MDEVGSGGSGFMSGGGEGDDGVAKGTLSSGGGSSEGGSGSGGGGSGNLRSSFGRFLAFAGELIGQKNFVIFGELGPKMLVMLATNK